MVVQSKKLQPTITTVMGNLYRLKKSIVDQANSDRTTNIILTVISTVLSTFLGFAVGYFFFEGVVISSNETISNDVVTVALNNENWLKSTSMIVIWGWDTINGEIVLDSYTRGSVGPRQNITRHLVVERADTNLSLKSVSTDDPRIKGIFKVEGGRLILRNTLFYRITCADCEGQDYWRPLREDLLPMVANCTEYTNNKTLDCEGSYTQLFWRRP